MRNKYRVRFQPLEFDIYADTEQQAMDIAYRFVDNNPQDQHIETVSSVNYLTDDDFYPLNGEVI